MSKIYIDYSLLDTVDIFRGYAFDYSVRTDVLSKLAKDLGFSYDLYNTLDALDQSAADTLVSSMSKKSKINNISLLVDDVQNEVLGYSLSADRLPLLNTEFVKRVKSLVETSDKIKLYETCIVSEDTVSSLIVRKVDPIELDLGTKKVSYDIGILIMNNELDSAYCRLVVFIEGQPVYLPASAYNVSTNRYKKSTSNTAEALEVLVLKVIDDLREEELKYKIADFDAQYRINKDILVTYEEYNNILRTMMKIPTVIEERSVLEPLISKYEEFERKYARLEDQKSSYIWRCTAIGELTIGLVSHIALKILGDLGAPACEYHSIRDLIGNYLSTNRIVAEIAKETI